MRRACVLAASILLVLADGVREEASAAVGRIQSPGADSWDAADGVGEGGQPLFSFGVVADVQYANAPASGSRDYAASAGKLEACVEHFNAMGLAFAIQLGDFVDRSFADYDAVLPIYNQLTAPHYHVLGNHDLSAGHTALVLEKFGLERGYYDYGRDFWRFIVLDTNNLDDEDQIAWLETTLNAAAAAGEQVVAFGHHPLDSIATGRQVIDLFEASGRVAAYFAGHEHAGGYRVEDGIHYVTVEGMVETADTTAYGVVEVYANHLRVVGYGRVKSRILSSRLGVNPNPEGIPLLRMRLGLDETGGPWAHDSGDFGYDGVLEGGLSFASDSAIGADGKALRFDGVDDRVVVPGVLDVPPAEGAISLWFNLAGDFPAAGRTDQCLACKQGGDGDVLSLRLRAYDGTLEGRIKDRRVYANATTWSAGTWHRVVLTWGSGGTQMIVDGVAQSDTDPFQGIISSDSTYPLHVGSYGQAVASYFFEGTIDDVRIYDWALSPEDLSLPEAAFARACSAGDESETTVTLQVALLGIPEGPVAVAYAVLGGTATPGEDYVPSVGALTFDPGVTTRSISLFLLDNWRYEADETVVIALTGASGAILGAPGRCTYIIRNDDLDPRMEVRPLMRQLIKRLYETILLRDPEYGAVDAWGMYIDYLIEQKVDIRFIPWEIARLFFLSREYAFRGRSDAEFLSDCYRAVIGRVPRSGEIGGWLAGAWNRAEVMAIFSNSEEFAAQARMLFPGLEGLPTRNLATTMYIGLLDRLADTSGLVYAAELFDAAWTQGGIEAVRAQ
ncbi:MAG TPA: LamG-like jellyroll fold domain-containing protein, partial [Sumerlaeia bacterium]|nr:LamG-like jellyroll fold domain-containing protein [Sumerlaeia bacterium]